MWKAIVKASVAVAGALIALKWTVGWAEQRLAFHPVRGLEGDPGLRGLPFREHRIPTSDGETVVAWEIPHPEPRAEVVFFHGNAGNLWTWLDFLREIHDQGFTVVALDYRGYGESTGKPTEKGLYRDVSALVERFRGEIHTRGRRVVFWGRSLGGPMAAFATRVGKPDGLILEATFPSVGSLMRHFPLLYLLRAFSSYRFPTAEFLADRTCPLLVIHGDNDEVVPVAEGERLYRGLGPPKEFYLVSGAAHSDINAIDSARYWERIKQFAEGLADSKGSHETGSRLMGESR